MRHLTYYVGTSLDGYIAGPDGELDFFPVTPDLIEHVQTTYPEVLPTPARQELGIDGLPNRRFDTVIMGWGTYQPALDVGITDPYAHLRTVVASRRVIAGTDPNVTVVQDPVAAVRALKTEPSDLAIWLAGGGHLASAVADEIDELIVKVYPVLAGGGIPVLSQRFHPQAFRPTGSVTLPSGCVVRAYERAHHDAATNRR